MDVATPAVATTAHADESYGNSEESVLIDILKAYYELCRRSEDKSHLLSDLSLQKTLTDYVLDPRPKVLLYVCKILLCLTEGSDGISSLEESAQLKANLWRACEKNFHPKVTRNLLRVHDRLSTTRLPSRKKKIFLGRNSEDQQFVFVFDELSDASKRSIETSCIRFKGVVSICFQDSRCIVRCKKGTEGKNVAKCFFSCGFDMVSMLVTSEEGKQELFDYYAESQLNQSDESRRREAAFPKYLDDYAEDLDPASCIITKEQLDKKGGEGVQSWFSALRFW